MLLYRNQGIVVIFIKTDHSQVVIVIFAALLDVKLPKNEI